MRAWIPLLAVACASIPVTRDYDPRVDFSRFRSYGWFRDGHEVEGNALVDSRLIERRVESAVAREMAEKGLERRAEGTPDLFVNYHISLRGRLSSSSVSSHYGARTRRSRSRVGASAGSQVSQFEEGTLVLDLIDAASLELVWRGSASVGASRGRSAEETTEIIDETVEAILAEYPPAR